MVMFILLLTSFNIHLISSSDKVLGIKTQAEDNVKNFWDEFLKEHPNYIPGLLETGQIEKVKQIDPNYFLP